LAVGQARLSLSCSAVWDDAFGIASTGAASHKDEKKLLKATKFYFTFLKKTIFQKIIHRKAICSAA
jgi:hypothetical protein